MLSIVRLLCGGLLLLLSTSALAAPPVRQPLPLSPAQTRSMLETLVQASALSRADADQVVRLHELPARAEVTVPAGMRGCGTVQFLRVREWLRLQGIELLRDPPQSIGHVASTRFPLRFFYNEASQIGLAHAALAAAEASWERQVVNRGYRQPWTLGDPDPVQPGMDFYFASSWDWAGLTMPLADVPSTPICDCSSRILIAQDMWASEMPATIEHELNHATQAATDCGESISAWECFATAVETVAFPDNWSNRHMMEEFQRFPEYPLDYWTQSYGEDPSVPNALYQYGAAMFPLFLKDRFGAGDAVALKDAWESFRQNGTMYVSESAMVCESGNDPDWLQGIDAWLQSQGSSLAEAFTEFSEWRAVVGRTWDDGHHFLNGEFYPAPAVAVRVVDFPRAGYLDTREYGTRYVEYRPTAAGEAPLSVRVNGDKAANWSGWVLLWKGSGQPVERIPLVFDSMKVATVDAVPLEGVTRVLLAVSQLDDGSHATDAWDYDTIRAFRYSLARAAGPDAGAPPGPDAGTAGPDAETPLPGPDAESPPPGPDAAAPSPGPDAETGEPAGPDAGTPPDGGAPPPGEETGCGCGAAGAPAATLAIAMLGLGVRRRRR